MPMISTAQLVYDLQGDTRSQIGTEESVLKLKTMTQFRGWRYHDIRGGTVAVHGYASREKLYESIPDQLIPFFSLNGFMCYPRALWQINTRLRKLPVADQLPQGAWREMNETQLSAFFGQYALPFKTRTAWNSTKTPGNLDRLGIACVGSDYQNSSFQTDSRYNPARALSEQLFPIWVSTLRDGRIWSLSLFEILIHPDLSPPIESILDTEILFKDPVFLITALTGSVPYESD